MGEMLVPLPKSVYDRLNKNTHPGLLLDKYVKSWEEPLASSGKLSERVQKPTVETIVKLSQKEPEGLNFPGLLRKWNVSLDALGARRLRAVTSGLLTLHLARASALENAGICLHPLYGFAYLPGSGLKGMARAYAETVWLSTQFEADAEGKPKDDTERAKAARAWRTIEAVFGWAPNSDKDKHWKPGGIDEKHKKEHPANAGNIIFHDAWPEAWPRLIVDITNNHHPAYYRGEDAPGDWENPVPVYFLAVEPGTTFSLALSKRRPDVEDALLALARQWLTGALCHMGAGAKTAAGYGAFKPVEEALPRLDSPTRAVFETTLELVTPAFLAGAGQKAEDCDLRPATLRGLLRWWWRTMHAGFVDVKTLRAMEAAVWGDTKSGGAVRIAVAPEKHLAPQRYAYKKGSRPRDDFMRAHELQASLNRKTTQGLFYASYGMDDGGRQRWYMPPGAEWTVRLTARASHYPADADPKKGKKLTAELVLKQARAALWLFCRFGGAGSKARKGFGSFADLAGMTMEDCKAAAREFRKECGLPEREEQNTESSALGKTILRPEVRTPWKDPWFALDQVGFSAQAFAQSYKHRAEKKALGLPRRIGSPVQGRFDARKGDRHASPVHYHLAKDADGRLIFRVIAFPAWHLPDIKQSHEFLEKLVDHLENKMGEQVKRYKEKGQTTETPPLHSAPAMRSQNTPKSGEHVEAVLLGEQTKKGGWKAKHEPSGLEGPVVNSADVPADKKPGDVVTLIVQSDNPKNPSFRWPSPKDRGQGKKRDPKGRDQKGR